jgi:hypothetical protein
MSQNTADGWAKNTNTQQTPINKPYIESCCEIRQERGGKITGTRRCEHRSHIAQLLVQKSDTVLNASLRSSLRFHGVFQLHQPLPTARQVISHSLTQSIFILTALRTQRYKFSLITQCIGGHSKTHFVFRSQHGFRFRHTHHSVVHQQRGGFRRHKHPHTHSFACTLNAYAKSTPFVDAATT